MVSRGAAARAMSRGMRPAAFVAVLVAGAACLQYSPHEVRLDSHERDLHERALATLRAAPPVQPLRFAVVGDTQMQFEDAEDAVRALKARDDLAFVVQVGDFTHWGLADEFRIMNRIFRELPVPYFVVVGIHDLLGTGRLVYEEMFGPLNFAFTHGGVRFALLDSNSREYDFDGTVPDLAWLAEQLAPSPEHDRAVVISHAPPDNPDFDPDLRADYFRVLREGGATLSLHGHSHVYQAARDGGVEVVTADDVAGRSYLVVTAAEGGGFVHERVGF
ncbi:metallophosphoesterase [Anaeromyxobacter sp. Fw109-5]|nr:metallophosphoesterase [Anaeromyxobacter sp. Fw109-5]